jgi:hypothetical protein
MNTLTVPANVRLVGLVALPRPQADKAVRRLEETEAVAEVNRALNKAVYEQGLLGGAS